MKQLELYIYGSKSYAQTIAGLARSLGYSVEGLVDDSAQGTKSPMIIGGYEALSDLVKSNGRCSLAVGVGYKDLPQRAALIRRLKMLDLSFPSLIHETSLIDQSSKIGTGSVVMRGAIVDLNVTLGEFTTLWPGVIVNHDSVIGDNTFVSPGSIICGNAKVGDGCFIGAGAIIVDGRTVPDGEFVKAGTVFK